MWFSIRVEKIHLCIKQGDAGAPLMCSLDGRWNLLGIGSNLYGSCGNNTSVYSRMSNLTSFIDTTVRRVEGKFEPQI